MHALSRKRKNKGSSILEFVAILPIFFLIFVVFLELGLILYTQSKLDHASFSVQTQLLKTENSQEDTIIFALEQMKQAGFTELQHETNEEGNVLDLKHHYVFITPLLPRLLKREHLGLGTSIYLGEKEKSKSANQL